MFKNPGKKIKILAKINFWLFVLAGIITAVLFVVSGLALKTEATNQLRNWKDWQFVVVGIGCLIGGIIIGFLSSLPFYAFGSLVEDTAENKAALHRIEEKMQTYTF